jgi:hypothetical protein
MPTVEDGLSRETDATDWGLSPGLYAQICSRFGTVPSVDLFAPDAHHMAEEFVSKTYTPGCINVDAFRADGGKLVEERTAWIFSLNRSVSKALSLVQDKRHGSYADIGGVQREHTIAKFGRPVYGALYDPKVRR